MDRATNYASATQLRPSLLSLIAGLGIKLPPEALPKHSKGTNSMSIPLKPRPASPTSPRRAPNPRALSPRPRAASPRPLYNRTGSPKAVRTAGSLPGGKGGRQGSPRPFSPRPALRTVSPRPMSPRASSPRPVSPRLGKTVRPVSPRTRSPVVGRLGYRPGSPKAQRVGISPRRSVPGKTEGALKRQTTSKPKPGKSSVPSKPLKRVSFSGIVAPPKAPAPAPRSEPSDPPAVLTPLTIKELEASKAMVSPRIEFDGRSQSPPPALATAGKSILKGKKEAALNAMVTKVDATSDPTDSSKSKSEMIIRKHLYQTFRGLKMARSLPLADPIQLQAKRVVLMKPPGKYRRKTAIFDLDETLVHCLDRTETAAPDVVLPIRFPNGDIVHVNST